MRLETIDEPHTIEGVFYPRSWIIEASKDEVIQCIFCDKELNEQAWFIRKGKHKYFSCLDHARPGNATRSTPDTPILMDKFGGHNCFHVLIKRIK